MWSCGRRATGAVRSLFMPYSAGWSRGAAMFTTESKKEVWVSATPRVCLHDVHTSLRAGGLTPNSPVTLSAHVTDENGRQFCSHAHYITDADGGVDVDVAASIGGSYKGVFPAGLLSTLAPASHERPVLRFYRRNPHKPWKIRVRLMNGHQTLEAQKEVMTEVELERHLTAPGVQRVKVHHGRVRGALYLPPGDGPFPGIIDMFGAVGGLMEFRSALLASRGFASLALALFAYDDLPKNMDEVDLGYFEDAVSTLLSQPQVIPDRCGAIAVSKSGEIVFSMATLFPPVKAAIGINACTMAFHSRFTYKGELYKQGIPAPINELKEDEHGAFSLDFSNKFNNEDPAMIPVEEADDETHFMIVAGEDDPWGFKHSVSEFRNRMLQHNRRNFETVVYPGAGHLIEPPYNPHHPRTNQPHFPGDSDIKDKETFKGIIMKWGGKPQPHCEAQVDLWPRMHTFLMRHVRDESHWYQKYLSDQSQKCTQTITSHL